MMKNADKWIRKYFVDTLNNMVVNGKTITIHDMRVPENKDAYILMTTQSKQENNEVKCGLRYDCQITLDVVTIYNNIAGSRLLADDIMEEVMKRTQSILIQNFQTLTVEKDFPADISTITSTQSIFRKLIIFNLKIRENG
ncbi:hypothetical protein [Elizabethkingia anophelis]|uniref:hypothetical protein n=1 Tax=Elizabethkingia anophelis TaxID=1117645 RepID=UPI000750FBCA|nr:hypothetical protein [Elizabethkingia anophelis]AQW91329.1 hypothetical protein BBD28_11975 [Elizabethkingia anophelis]KUY14195.1 hypothetical protein ATB94_09355 [Elizabethkingia anophelis]